MPTAEDAAFARSSSQLLSRHTHANRPLKLSLTDGEQERLIELLPVWCYCSETSWRPSRQDEA